MRAFLIFSTLASFVIANVQLRADIIDDIEDLEGPIKKEEKPPVRPAIPDPQGGMETPQEKSDAKPEGKSSKDTAAKKKDAAKAPIKLKSDGRSTYTKDGGVMILRKNVVITQDELRLQADEAKVIVDKTNKDESVKRVEINGQVKVSKFSVDPAERITGHGNRAIFSNKKQTVKLIGNARLFKGGHLIKGKQIVYDIQTGLITVDQAQGVVQPQEAK